jgi:hypothetical protein
LEPTASAGVTPSMDTSDSIGYQRSPRLDTQIRGLRAITSPPLVPPGPRAGPRRLLRRRGRGSRFWLVLDDDVRGRLAAPAGRCPSVHVDDAGHGLGSWALARSAGPCRPGRRRRGRAGGRRLGGRALAGGRSGRGCFSVEAPCVGLAGLV